MLCDLERSDVMSWRKAFAPLQADHFITGWGGADISPLTKAGVLSMALAPDASRYFDLHHTANDTFDKVDPAQLAQNVAVFVTWSYMAAQADGDFGSRPGAFKNGIQDH